MAYQLDHHTTSNTSSMIMPSTWGCKKMKPSFFICQLYSILCVYVLRRRNPSPLRWFHRLVASCHQRIQRITEIRSIQLTFRVSSMDHRLLYGGIQLHFLQMILERDIQNADTLQLFGKMWSTHHPHTSRLVNELNSRIHDLCNRIS